MRIFLWSLVIIAIAVLSYFYFNGTRYSQSSQTAQVERLGGRFNLTRHDGKPISDVDLLGRPHAIFFGFTNCPEVCPTTLYEITTWLEILGEEGNGIDIYFMSVDPERDTMQFLSEYLTAFDTRIVGITGDKDKVEKTLRAFNVYFNRVELSDGDYTMDHSAMIYLMNSDGKFVGSIAYGEDSDSAVQKLRNLLN